MGGLTDRLDVLELQGISHVLNSPDFFARGINEEKVELGAGDG